MDAWIPYSKHGQEFVAQGYSVVPAQSLEGISRIRSEVVKSLRLDVKDGAGLGDEEFLNRFHLLTPAGQVNAIRLRLHRELGGLDSFRRAVFEEFQAPLRELLGSELVMQRNVNLVVHPPRDSTGLLYLHTDAWSGCSPYEVILWVPLVRVGGTKSMQLCPKEPTFRHLRALKKGLELSSASELASRVAPDLKPVEMKFGQGLLFSSTLLHGAEENKTEETRFALNVRFKSLFSPYGAKGLGETFSPIEYLPSTEIGLSYEGEFGTC